MFVLKYLILQGFTINGEPVLDRFIDVKGTFETATRATTRCPPTVLLHIRHETVKHLAHFAVTTDMISEYYVGEASGNLKVIDLEFNIYEEEALESWINKGKKLAEDLCNYDHVVVFVTTHSEPDRGDMWLGEDSSKERNAVTISDVSTGLYYHFTLILTINSQWLNFILGPFNPILNGALLYLLACGSVVKIPRARADLKNGLARQVLCL